MVKLATEIEEPTFDVGEYDVVSHPITSSRGKWWRAMLSFFSRPADLQVDGASVQEKPDCMRLMRLDEKMSTDSFESMKQPTENRFPIREETGLVSTH